jgi:hypothetical protein
MNALAELERLGYECRLCGGDIGFTWRGGEKPPTDRVLGLIRSLKESKGEAVRYLRERAAQADEFYSLICESVEIISSTYVAGGIEWVKVAAPEWWAEIQKLEDEIDGLCKDGKREMLVDALDRLVELWRRISAAHSESGLRGCPQ